MAPVCNGRPGFWHRPIHCKRMGFGFFHGLCLAMWRCPRCGQRHFRG
jgi:predicted Zn-ribbon and HTH transcriptional regulator